MTESTFFPSYKFSCQDSYHLLKQIKQIFGLKAERVIGNILFKQNLQFKILKPLPVFLIL